MNAGLVGLIVGLVLGANGGVILACALAKRAREDAAHEAYLSGVQKGRALAHVKEGE